MTDALNILEGLLPDQAPPIRRRAKRTPVDLPPTFPPLPPPELCEPDGVLLIRGSSLTPQPIVWLWRSWLARGKFHILAGAPGQGKTTLALTMAATITIGGRFPDGSRCEAGNVLVWSGEDDPQDTLAPRLAAAGADLDRVFFVISSRIGGQVVPFDPARDMAHLMNRVDEIGGVHLLIVDPVVSAVAGDSHKNTEVRRALQPLVDLAGITGAAVLGISHFSKGGQGQDPTQRVVGSIAFSAVARVVLVAAKVKTVDGTDRRILARSKSNIGPDDGGFEYHLEQVEPQPGIEASRVAWGQMVAGTARDLLTDPNEEEDAPEAGAKDSAVEFLRELLAEGPTPTKTVEAEAKAAGIAWRTVRRASDDLHIIKKKSEGAWYWQLAQLGNLSKQVVQLAHLQKHGQVGQHGQVAPEDSEDSHEGSTFLNAESSAEMESSGTAPDAAEPPPSGASEERF